MLSTFQKSNSCTQRNSYLTGCVWRLGAELPRSFSSVELQLELRQEWPFFFFLFYSLYTYVKYKCGTCIGFVKALHIHTLGSRYPSKKICDSLSEQILFKLFKNEKRINSFISASKLAREVLHMSSPYSDLVWLYYISIS